MLEFSGTLRNLFSTMESANLYSNISSLSAVYMQKLLRRIYIHNMITMTNEVKEAQLNK